MKTFYIGKTGRRYVVSRFPTGWKKHKTWGGIYWNFRYPLVGFCVRMFERTTGLKLKPGQLVKVRLEVVEEVK